MKVLLWTQYFWPEHFHINEVAGSLSEAGEDVTVLTGKPNYPDGAVYDGYRVKGVTREVHRGIELIRLPLRPRGRNDAKGIALNYLSFIFSGYLRAPFALKRRKCDVVFVYATSPILQALPAIFIAWLKRVPLVLWVQDLWPEALISTGYVRNRAVLRAVEWVVRYIYRHSDLILIQSEAFRDPVERLGGETRKVHVHPNSVQVSPPKGRLGAQTLSIVDDVKKHFSVVYAGNIGSVQSTDTVLAAANLLRDIGDIKFYVIGSGSAATSMAATIERCGMTNIVMPGRVPADEISAIYEVASVLLVSMKDDPLISRTIPSKLQAYMATGKPIIVSGNGEPARVLREAQAGLTCPAGDAQALADAVRALRDMPAQQRAKLGENGRAWFDEHYNLRDRTLALIEHFKRAIEDRNGGNTH